MQATLKDKEAQLSPVAPYSRSYGRTGVHTILGASDGGKSMVCCCQRSCRGKQALTSKSIAAPTCACCCAAAATPSVVPLLLLVCRLGRPCAWVAGLRQGVRLVQVHLHSLRSTMAAASRASRQVPGCPQCTFVSILSAVVSALMCAVRSKVLAQHVSLPLLFSNFSVLQKLSSFVCSNMMSRPWKTCCHFGCLDTCLNTLGIPTSRHLTPMLPWGSACRR